ncbi:hypothetical protein A8C32_10035 [Flavivirga aquatica]|uniref:Uncharacterized protein n=1 Tax=Flavivirga aquatica TaxID=1849968 RepID=A0A1E5TEP7_9FLAO|nr:hypothetical protein [Flavivirga aquatica]OEK09841.1 hypothetical protein A8C32_10035 [Flavivirga aquatica]
MLTKTINQLNYAYFKYYKEFVKQNDYNVFGGNGITGGKYTNSEKNIVYVKDTVPNYRTFFDGRKATDFYRIHYWDSFDMRKDSIPADFNWEALKKLRTKTEKQE